MQNIHSTRAATTGLRKGSGPTGQGQVSRAIFQDKKSLTATAASHSSENLVLQWLECTHMHYLCTMTVEHISSTTPIGTTREEANSFILRSLAYLRTPPPSYALHASKTDSQFCFLIQSETVSSFELIPASTMLVGHSRYRCTRLLLPG